MTTRLSPGETPDNGMRETRTGTVDVGGAESDQLLQRHAQVDP